MKVSLLADGFENFSEDFLKKIADDICYFKIMLSNILHKIEYSEFLKNLNVICKNKDAVVHIKAYLDEEQSEFYKKAISDFENLGVQIFQVSKELIPLGVKNAFVSQDVQSLIREFEKTYDGKNGIKFLSVKDISTLFYPRFELDEGNSRNCYACVLKPYIYGNKILPCKVLLLLFFYSH